MTKKNIKKEVEIVHEMSRLLHCMDILRNDNEALERLAEKYIELKKIYISVYETEIETAQALIESVNPILERYGNV